MKNLIVILAIICSAYALPKESGSERQSRFVDGIIADLVEDVSNTILEAGLDPYHLDAAEASFKLPVPILFSIGANIKNLNFRGASNIIINYINWSLIRRRVDLDISLPELFLSIDEAAAEVVVFGKTLSADVKGSLVITQPRVTGYMTFGIIGGINLSSINLEFDLGGLFSLMDVNILGQNYAGQINQLITHEIPATMQEFSAEINELITIIVGDIVRRELSG